MGESQLSRRWWDDLREEYEVIENDEKVGRHAQHFLSECYVLPPSPDPQSRILLSSTLLPISLGEMFQTPYPFHPRNSATTPLGIGLKRIGQSEGNSELKWMYEFK